MKPIGGQYIVMAYLTHKHIDPILTPIQASAAKPSPTPISADQRGT